MLFRISYVGTQAHHLLASRDLNAGNIQTCLGLTNLSNLNPNNVLSAPASSGGVPTSCGPFGADSEYFIPAGTVVPADPTLSALPPQPFKVPTLSCAGLVLPYNGAPGGNPTCFSGTVGPSGLTLVGTRPFSSPNCGPSSGVGCPGDAVPVFSNIFAGHQSLIQTTTPCRSLSTRASPMGCYFRLPTRSARRSIRVPRLKTS